MTLPLLDTNVLLRHLLQDHADHSPKATRFIARVESGDAEVRITDLVMLEVVFTLQREQRVPRDVIRDKLNSLLELPGLILPGKQRWRRVLEAYASRGLSFVDSYHLAMMEHHGTNEIVSFDQGFDRIPNITRIEP